MTSAAQTLLFRLLCLDPVHVGIGQDIMGEVDLPIDREPQTGVPRIPGPTLKGGFRAHARWKLRMENTLGTQYCPGDKPVDEDEEWSRTDLCGVRNCPICQTFGWPAYPQGAQVKPGSEGRIFFSDARLAFFPAVTNHGTLWFTTPGRACAYLDMGKALGVPPADPLLEIYPELVFGQDVVFAMSQAYADLNVGWIKITGLPCDAQTDASPLKEVVQTLRDINGQNCFPTRTFWEMVSSRTILLDETNFYRVVETCLERRTCNKINVETGTVQDDALFSYEALPRHTLLYSRLTIADQGFPNRTDDFPYDSPLAICNKAREGLARMGIGGLQTRGLGSILVEPLTPSAL